MPAVDLRGLDFLFILAFVLGLYALHRLLAIREEGEVEQGIVVNGLLNEMRLGVQTSTAAGLKYFMYLPSLIVEKMEVTKKTRRKKHGNSTNDHHAVGGP